MPHTTTFIAGQEFIYNVARKRALLYKCNVTVPVIDSD